MPHGHVWHYNPICKECEQTERDKIKNADRPLHIIKERTKTAAAKAGVPFDFMWTNMNWRALVPHFRAMMTAEGLCVNCGHDFISQYDIHCDHREPPRHNKDLARIHARNIGILCATCNIGKGDRTYSEWLDIEESKRLSFEKSQSNEQSEIAIEPSQILMWANLPEQRKPP